MVLETPISERTVVPPAHKRPAALAKRVLRTLPGAAKVVQERGLRFIWTYVAESLWFDIQHHTRTSWRVPKELQALPGGSATQNDGVLYVASFTSVVRRTVGLAETILGKDRAERAQFLDLGCGKGKALLVYCLTRRYRSRFPAIGIEYDSGLAEMADRNLSVCGFDENDARVFTDNATSFAAHTTANIFVVYSYNSFRGSTFDRVLANLAGTPHLLIYVDPVEKADLIRHGYTIHAESKGRYNADTWLLASRNLFTEDDLLDKRSKIKL